MNSQAVILVVTAAIVIFVGIWVISLVSQSFTLPYTPTAVVNESVSFQTNNSYTAFTYPAVESVSRVGNNSLTLTSGNYTANTTHISMTFLGTVTNGTYNVSYTYDLNNTASVNTLSSVTTTVWNTFMLLAVALVVVAASVILSYFGFGMRDD